MTYDDIERRLKAADFHSELQPANQRCLDVWVEVSRLQALITAAQARCPHLLKDWLTDEPFRCETCGFVGELKEYDD